MNKIKISESKLRMIIRKTLKEHYLSYEESLDHEKEGELSSADFTKAQKRAIKKGWGWGGGAGSAFHC